MARYEIKERTRRGERERLCNRCGMWWALDRFEKNPKCPDGRTGECRLCRAERRAGHRAKTKESA